MVRVHIYKWWNRLRHNTSTLDQVKLCLFTLALPQFLSLSGVLFLSQCTVSSVILVVPLLLVDSENKASSCFGCTMADTRPLSCHLTVIFRPEITSFITVKHSTLNFFYSSNKDVIQLEWLQSTQPRLFHIRSTLNTYKQGFTSAEFALPAV